MNRHVNLLSLLLFTILAPSAHAAKSYCCSDERGRQVCGDSLPKECYGRAYREINCQGVTVRRVDAPLNAEQRALKEAEARKAKEEAVKRMEQDRRNRALLATYATEQDIDNARDRAVADIEKIIKESQDKQAELAMAESESRFREIFNAVSDAVSIHDAETGRLIDVNHRVCEMYGLTREEALACGPDDVSAGTSPYSSAEVIEKIHLARTKGPQTFDWLARARDGHLFWVEVSLRFALIGNQPRILAVVRDITERKATEEQIRNLAFYDTLTQLPNRRLLNDRLKQTMAASKRSGRYGALMFLDMDNFKPLNDTHGHDVGDLLLVETAQRLTSCVREMDTIARFGGDEFMVMLGELDGDKAESATQAGIVAEKIRATLAEPYLLKLEHEAKTETTVEHHCTSSIGVVLFIDHAASTEEIIKWADMAMYQAKEAGGNLIRFYDPEKLRRCEFIRT